MTAIARVTLISLVLGLSACAVHRPEPAPAPPIETLPPAGPASKPAPPATPQPPAAKPMPRTSYRWNNGWSGATSPQGPWEATDTTGVPAGLGRQHP